MEHYRRLGFADKLRAQGLPADYPTDIAYFTRFIDHELARFQLPSARAARDMVKTLTGSWSAAELPHRVSQMYVEDVLRSEAAAQPTRLDPLRLADDRHQPGRRRRVEVEAETRGRRTRRRSAPPTRSAPTAAQPDAQGAGIELCRRRRRVARLHGRADARAPFPQQQGLRPHPASAGLDVLDGQSPTAAPACSPSTAATNSRFTPSSRRASADEDISDAEATTLFHRALGAPLDIEIICALTWNAGYTLVADELPPRPHVPRRRRGASVHADRRAWLQHRGRGRGQSGLEARRDAQGLGRTGAARQLPDRAPGAGEAQHRLRARLCRFGRAVRAGAARSRTTARPAKRRARRAGDHFNRARARRVQHSRHHLRRPLRRLGRSSCRTAPRRRRTPPTPTSRPPAPAAARRICGSTTAARSTTRSASSSRCCGSAPSRRTPRRSSRRPRRRACRSTIVDVASDEARDLYAADLALIRPDQIVAWRGNSAADAARRAAPGDGARLTACRSVLCSREPPQQRLALAHHLLGREPRLGRPSLPHRCGTPARWSDSAAARAAEERPAALARAAAAGWTAPAPRWRHSRTRPARRSALGRPRRPRDRSGPRCARHEMRREIASRSTSGRSSRHSFELQRSTPAPRIAARQRWRLDMTIGAESAAKAAMVPSYPQLCGVMARSAARCAQNERPGSTRIVGLAGSVVFDTTVEPTSWNSTSNDFSRSRSMKLRSE